MARLRGKVVVVTGASSGIGRATALAFAKERAAVVLIARSEAALRDVAEACERLGGRALVAAADVTDEETVRTIARQAVVTFGRIDVWVNNAAVTHFGAFDDVPTEVFRRVFETNFFGYVNGARAAIPVFRSQGRGLLVNVASGVGKMPQPFTSAYTASKFAIRGFSLSLRQELLGTGIHVSTILPPSIDTPLFQHGANHSGRAPKPIDPVYRAEKVARAIVRCARRPRREVPIGGIGVASSLLPALLPGRLLDRLVRSSTEKHHFQPRAAAAGVGNLFQPREPLSVDGGWRAGISRRPARSYAMALLAVGAVALAGRGAAALAR